MATKTKRRAKVKHSEVGWNRFDKCPRFVELVEWEDTECISMTMPLGEVKSFLGRVFSVGLVTKENKRVITLAQSLYVPSKGTRLGVPLIGELVTIPKSLIRRRTIIAKDAK